MTSTHLSSAVLSRDHRHLMFTENEDQAQPRTFHVVADVDVGQKSSKRELSSSSVDQSLPKVPPGSKSPKHTILSHSKEKLDKALYGFGSIHASDTSNGKFSLNPLHSSGPFTYPGPHRIFCDNCDEWIVIKDAEGNDIGDWDEHALNCAYSRKATDPSPPVAGDASASLGVNPALTGDSGEANDTNIPYHRRKARHSEPEHLTYLQGDPRAETVEDLQSPNRRRKSIAVKKLRREDPSGPAMELDEVAIALPIQTRRTEEERIRFLHSDPHATVVEPHRVLCGICRRWIQLRKNSTYCTAPWVQHVQKCAAKHEKSREIIGTTPAAYFLGQEGEVAGDTEDTASRSIPQKRPRGRPRKRRLSESGQGSGPSYTLRPVAFTSRSPSGLHQESRRTTPSPPPPLRTPSPPLSHPHPQDVYWYPNLPPMTSYYSLYAGSQYNKDDDSYSLYFRTPQSQPPGQPSSHAPDHAKSLAETDTSASGPPSEQGGSSSNSGLLPPFPIAASDSFDADGISSMPGRTWIVWRLKDYSSNSCPMDHDGGGAPVPRASASSETFSAGPGPEPRPMYRSGTWPHLMGPEAALELRQQVSPHVHPAENGTGSSSGAHSSRYSSHPISPPLSRPPAEDHAMISALDSSAPSPVRSVVESYGVPPPSRHQERHLQNSVPKPPDPPDGSDLDSPECRLAYTFKSIAFLFRTSFQGEDDMSLDTLMAFMNHRIPREKMYDSKEVSDHVAILGTRKKLVFTREGGVQLAPPSP